MREDRRWRAKTELAENQAQLKLHEESYGNSLEKIKHASGKLSSIREKIQKYDAELKMGKAEAEIAKLAGTFNFDVTTDFGKIEQVIQDKIGLNKAKVRVAADLSHEANVDRSPWFFNDDSRESRETVKLLMSLDFTTMLDGHTGQTDHPQDKVR